MLCNQKKESQQKQKETKYDGLKWKWRSEQKCSEWLRMSDIKFSICVDVDKQQIDTNVLFMHSMSTKQCTN